MCDRPHIRQSFLDPAPTRSKSNLGNAARFSSRFPTRLLLPQPFIDTSRRWNRSALAPTIMGAGAAGSAANGQSGQPARRYSDRLAARLAVPSGQQGSFDCRLRYRRITMRVFTSLSAGGRSRMGVLYASIGLPRRIWSIGVTKLAIAMMGTAAAAPGRPLSSSSSDATSVSPQHSAEDERRDRLLPEPRHRAAARRSIAPGRGGADDGTIGETDGNWWTWPATTASPAPARLIRNPIPPPCFTMAAST